MQVARTNLELANKVPDGEELLSLRPNIEGLKVKCFEKHIFFIFPFVLLLAVISTVTKCMPRLSSYSYVAGIINCIIWWYILTKKMWIIRIFQKQLFLNIIWVDILIHYWSMNLVHIFISVWLLGLVLVSEKCHVITTLQKMNKLMSIILWSLPLQITLLVTFGYCF